MKLTMQIPFAIKKGSRNGTFAKEYRKEKALKKALKIIAKHSN